MVKIFIDKVSEAYKVMIDSKKLIETVDCRLHLELKGKEC